MPYELQNLLQHDDICDMHFRRRRPASRDQNHKCYAEAVFSMQEKAIADFVKKRAKLKLTSKY